MQRKVVQQKLKIKVDKDALGTTWNCLYDYTIPLGEGKFLNPVTKKRYREININTTNDLQDNDKNRY
jgi:hypothetical protein